MSIDTPWEATAVTVDGKRVPIERQLERGYKAYSLFLDVPPGGGPRTVIVDLAGAVPPGDRYRLEVGTQPLVTPDRFDLSVDAAGHRAVGIDGHRVPRGHPVAASVPLDKENTVYDVMV